MSNRGVISYPIPVYQNVPIEPQFYQPNRFEISSITLGTTTTVTTTEDLNYEIGQEVRLIIPSAFGSYQLNGKTGIVLEVSGTDTVILNIDSSQNVDAFVSATIVSPVFGYAVAQILAIGDINSGNVGSSGRVDVPTNVIGSFLNISPE